MPVIRGITISVGYAELLRITLVRNMRHMAECVVVTSPDDGATQQVASSIPGVRPHVTDAFTRHGAAFNKGLGMEEGFDILGRHGFILIHDADILFPESMPSLESIQPGILYGASRRILENPDDWHPEFDWRKAIPTRDGGPIGFFQLFHADDSHLAGKRPWYDVTFAHAGGGDAYFYEHWPSQARKVLPIETLHLGPRDKHWFGTSREAIDVMDAFVIRNGWTRAAQKADRTAHARVGEITERVDVPGYPRSTYELPFVRRHRARQRPG